MPPVRSIMKKALIIIAASAAFFVSGTGLAQTPSPTITVVAEPPGDNCEFGGVKVTVTPADEPEPTPDPTEEPTPDPTEEPTPDPTEDPTEEPTEPPTARVSQAEPEVEYICNGQPGEPGDAGNDGQDGADGDNGDGTRLDGMDADFDTPGIQATRANRCATAGTKKVKVPKRFHNGTKVRVTANGQRRSSRVRKHKVSANLRTVPCGYYPVLVQKRGMRSALVVLRLTPRRVIRSTVK